jgi:threonine/homoserine/homoserine lactone efflux protein
MISTEFFFTSLAIVAAPGTGVVFTISTGLVSGKKSAVAAAVGCALGIVPHLALGILGIIALVQFGTTPVLILKYAGVLYLFYLAFNFWNNKSELSVDEKTDSGNWLTIIVRAVLINLLNPKLTLFFLAFLPQFIQNSETNQIYLMLILGFLFMLMTLVVFLSYGLLADFFKYQFFGSPKMNRLINIIVAIVFTLFALRVAFSSIE